MIKQSSGSYPSKLGVYLKGLRTAPQDLDETIFNPYELKKLVRYNNIEPFPFVISISLPWIIITFKTKKIN